MNDFERVLRGLDTDNHCEPPARGPAFDHGDAYVALDRIRKAVLDAVSWHEMTCCCSCCRVLRHSDTVGQETP